MYLGFKTIDISSNTCDNLQNERDDCHQRLTEDGDGFCYIFTSEFGRLDGFQRQNTLSKSVREITDMGKFSHQNRHSSIISNQTML